MQVLVVEDNTMLAEFLVEALTEDGHVVCGVAATVADAVALMQQYRPDVGIVDMQLSDGERGTEVADRLVASGGLGRTGILYVSGETEQVCLEARAGHACLEKPYTFETLNASLEIVREIACDHATSRPLPQGLQLLRSAAAPARGNA